MKKEFRMEYLEATYTRYKKSSKESKRKILDELCRVCKYNRKYAIWKLSQLPLKGNPDGSKKRCRSKAYGLEVLKIVEEVWKVANYP